VLPHAAVAEDFEVQRPDGVGPRTFRIVGACDCRLRLGPDHRVEDLRVIFKLLGREAAGCQSMFRYGGWQLEDGEHLCELREELIEVTLDRNVADRIIVRNQTAASWQCRGRRG
jgi:hypothetical protein